MAQRRCVSLNPLRQHAYVLLLTGASWESHARARVNARVSLQALHFDQVRQIVTPTTMPTIITKVMEKTTVTVGLANFAVFVYLPSFLTATTHILRMERRPGCRICAILLDCAQPATALTNHRRFFFLLTPPLSLWESFC